VFDLIVIGSGIAGLYAAITAAPRARVALLTKGELDDGCSRFAQGGIAAAVGSADSVARHYEDTMAAGRGLCKPEAVRVLVEEGPDRVRQLIEWSVAFDTQDGELLLAREAAHSTARILHARGDATGLEIETVLIRKLRASPVSVCEHTVVTRLIVDDSCACIGVETVADTGGVVRRLAASAVILATGGASRLWRNTTNPSSATGDGVALAYNAGADVSGMEFIQFHPTALALEDAPRFLISEAVRGEGALVVNGDGKRFLFDTDPRGELAGRDVVAKAIWEELQHTGASCVYLDCSPLANRAAVRFPAIARTCRQYSIDIERDLIPIAPAAHYTIGGVTTDVDGATSVDRLFACGEVANSGVHGANRLASNSLLESAVFAERAANAALKSIGEAPPPRLRDTAVDSAPARGALNAAPRWTQLQDTMWANAGVVRDGAGLRAALAECEVIAATCADSSLSSIRLRAAATTASLVCTAALAREESRGAHFRSDFPTRSTQWHGDFVMHYDRGGRLDCHV
jgi:L-aspartate oxidase